MSFNLILIPQIQILGESASRAIAVVILDFIFVKLGCYFLNIQGSSQVVDLIAYGGYKFVGYELFILRSLHISSCMHISSVILTITAGFLKFSGPLWTLVFIYSFLANAFFLVSCSFYVEELHIEHCIYSSSDHCALSSSRIPRYPSRQTQTRQQP